MKCSRTGSINLCALPSFNFFWLFHFQNFPQQKTPFLIWGDSTKCFCILHCLFFLYKASTCVEDRWTDFCNHFCTIICVLVVQIWITCIKCKENAVNHLNIANEPQKMPTLHGNDFIAYVNHTKNIISNKEYTSTISQNLSGSL